MKKKFKILIIEDEESLLETLKLKLIKEGFNVDTATDGQVGLAKIKTIRPDLLLLDLKLPSMTGQEIMRQLKKERGPHIPTVVISNSGQPVEIKEVLDLGADDYIVKANFTIDDVLERVYNSLERQTGRPDVIIAEDESFLRMVLAKKLRLEGLKVVTCVDGDTTLKAALDIKPKVLVLDLLMPGISGLDLLKTLKTNKDYKAAGMKILVLSNYSGKENEPIIKEMTIGYFIKSNFDIDEIAAEVKKWVAKK